MFKSYICEFSQLCGWVSSLDSDRNDKKELNDYINKMNTLSEENECRLEMCFNNDLFVNMVTWKKWSHKEWPYDKFGHCEVSVALLEDMPLWWQSLRFPMPNLGTVCTQRLLLPVDEDIDLSAPSPAAGLPEHSHVLPWS